MPTPEPQDNRAERNPGMRNSGTQDSHEPTSRSGKTVMDRLKHLQGQLNSSKSNNSKSKDPSSRYNAPGDAEPGTLQPKDKDVPLRDFTNGSRDHAGNGVGNGEDTGPTPEAREEAKEEAQKEVEATSDAPADISRKIDALLNSLLQRRDRLRSSEPDQMEDGSTVDPSNATQNGHARPNGANDVPARPSPTSMFDIAKQFDVAIT